jgi:hypothetical protein
MALALIETESNTAILDPDDPLGAQGKCTIRLGPTAAGESWTIERLTVLNDSDIDVWNPVATVYRNYVGPGSQIAGTFSGNRDTDTDNIPLRELECVFIVWTGIDPASNSQVVIEGTRTLRGAAIY